MPINGRIAKWDRLHLAIGTDAPAICHLTSLYTPNVVDVSVGVQIDLQTTPDSGWSATYYGPNAPFGGYGMSGSGSSATIDVHFVNWRLYAVNPGGENYLWHVFWDSIEIYANGSLLTTLGGGDQVSTALGPSWIPIFNGLVSVFGAASTNTASATISGGWRYKIGSDWYAPPVQPGPPPSNLPTTHNPTPTLADAPFGLSYVDCIVSTSTYGDHIASSNYDDTTLYPDGYLDRRQTQNYYGSIFLVPNLPKSIERMNADFGATFWSYGSPTVYGNGRRQWICQGTAGNSGGLVEVNRLSTTIAPNPPGSYEVGPDPSPLEGYFSLPTYAPIFSAQSKSDTKTVGDNAGTLYNKIEEVDFQFPYLLNDSGCAAYMSHSDPVCDYFNSAVCHPHWSIGHFTGPWNLYGSTTHWAEYWGPIREQFMSAQGRRNHNVSCALEESGFTPFLDYYFTSPTGDGMRWIGVSRWQTQTLSPPATLTPDATSSPAWSAVDDSCALAFGSAITVTPAGGVCKFAIDLARFDCLPFFYGQLAASITPNWSPANVAAVKVFVVSSDGSTRTLLKQYPTDSGTAPAISYPIPQTLDARYAGSWGIDNGAGAAADEGIDVHAGGMSAATMGDVRRQLAFAMLEGRQAAALYFEATPLDPALPITIQYPIFSAAAEKITLYENAQIANLLYADGPGIRLGNHIWYDEGLQIPPLSSGLGYKGTIIDWLCDRRIIAGVSPTGGTPDLTTELTLLYDEFEGQSVGAVDRDGIYFVLPQHTTEGAIRAALINTWSEVPPLAGYPVFERDPATWLPTSALCQRTWALCQTPRRIATAGSDPIDLYRPDGTTQVTSASALTISGWTITEHSSIVDNTEGVDWFLISRGSKWAKVTPWHGYFGLLGAPVSAKRPALMADWQGRLSEVTIVDGDVRFSRSDFSVPPWTIQVPGITGFSDVVSAWPGFDPTTSRFIVRVCRLSGGGYSIYSLFSDDDGATWSTPTLEMSNALLPSVGAGWDGSVLDVNAQYVSGTSGQMIAKGAHKGPGDSAFSAPFTLVDGAGVPLAVADGTLGNAVMPRDGQARWVLVFVVEGESNSSTWQSFDDGRTWTRAS